MDQHNWIFQCVIENLMRHISLMFQPYFTMTLSLTYFTRRGGSIFASPFYHRKAEALEQWFLHEDRLSTICFQNWWRHQLKLLHIQFFIFFASLDFSGVLFAKMFFKPSHHHHNDIAWLFDVIRERDLSDLAMVFAFLYGK